MTNSIINTCMKEGDYVLHSGQKSKYIFDVMKLITNEEFLTEFREFINGDHFLVGIEFGGSLLVANHAGCHGNFAIIRKDGTIYGNPIPKGYVLFDDVVTTENSVRKAMEQIYNQTRHYPDEIKCVVDRRNKNIKSLHIESMLDFDEKEYNNVNKNNEEKPETGINNYFML